VRVTENDLGSENGAEAPFSCFPRKSPFVSNSNIVSWPANLPPSWNAPTATGMKNGVGQSVDDSSKIRLSLCILSYECVCWGDKYDAGHSDGDRAGHSRP